MKRKLLFILIQLGVFVNTFAIIKEVISFNCGKNSNESFTVPSLLIKSQKGSWMPDTRQIVDSKETAAVFERESKRV